MLKKVILIFILIFAFLGLFVFSKKDKSADDYKDEIHPPEEPFEQVFSFSQISQNLPLSNNPKDIAWTLFQKYLEYNKNRNLEGLGSTVYKLAPVCEDPKQRIDCEARMGSAYAYGKEMKKENFTNVWSDEKQIILSTDFWIENSDDMNIIGRFRSIIFLVKNDAGDWKILSWSPTKGGATSKGAASEEELQNRILTWTEDRDEDGIADYSEECLDKPGDTTCTKTNPKLRDSNSNGWWDGVEALM